MYAKNYLSSKVRHIWVVLRSRRWLLIAASLVLPVGSFFISLAVIHALNPIQTKETPLPPAAVVSKTKAIVRPALPARIEIPSASISASVKPFGVNAQGNMDIDENIVNVAWYKDGPRPGEKGSAVIAGHYGWKEGQASVFNQIHTLKKGDKLSVIDEAGNTVTFVTQRIEKYDPLADTSEIFLSNDGKAHLNLITCDGTWDNAKNSYTERLVVFTDKET